MPVSFNKKKYLIGMKQVSIVAVKDPHTIIGYTADRTFAAQLRVTSGNIEQAYISGGNIIVQYTEGGRRYVNTYKTDWTLVSKLPL